MECIKAAFIKKLCCNVRPSKGFRGEYNIGKVHWKHVYPRVKVLHDVGNTNDIWFFVNFSYPVILPRNLGFNIGVRSSANPKIKYCLHFTSCETCEVQLEISLLQQIFDVDSYFGIGNNVLSNGWWNDNYEDQSTASCPNGLTCNDLPPFLYWKPEVSDRC